MLNKNIIKKLNNISNTNKVFEVKITSNNWLLESETGLYYKDVDHNLATKYLFISALNDASDSVELAHKYINDNTVRIYSDSTMDINLYILATTDVSLVQNQINDDIVSDGKTWSSEKVSQEIERHGILVGNSTGVNDSIQIQDAINKASGRKCKVFLSPNQIYKINETLVLKNNVIIDLNGSTLLKVNTNINSRIIHNESITNIDNPNENIGIINGVLVGNGSELGVSDQGAAIGIINANNVLLENIKTNNTNGDGIQWRRANNVIIRDVVIGDYGRNGISPTSGLNTIWNNVKVIGKPLAGANPGKAIDAETNSVNEKGSHIAYNIQCSDLTLVDFYNEEGSEFSQSWILNDCKIGPKYNALKIKSTNNTNANIVINGCEISTSSGSGGAIVIDNVNNGSINNCRIINNGSTGTTIGINCTNTVENWDFNNIKTLNFNYDIQSYSTSKLNNSIVKNCNLNKVYLTGNGNIFKNSIIKNIRLIGIDSSNTFDLSTQINSISAEDGALIQNQIFGDNRGVRSKSFYSNSVKLNDGTSHVMTIPIPDASTLSRCFMLFAGYSYGGRVDHSASLLAVVTTGKLSTSINKINEYGSKNIEITKVTQTEIELTLTYRYAGNFSVTLIG